ncbi:MAG: hypothetical protein LZF60_380017 [Nitrospira sp.]|nr:MAG: hypothetical protein LZF60_380017 [Nitrospira sp.]
MNRKLGLGVLALVGSCIAVGASWWVGIQGPYLEADNYEARWDYQFFFLMYSILPIVLFGLLCVGILFVVRIVFKSNTKDQG